MNGSFFFFFFYSSGYVSSYEKRSSLISWLKIERKKNLKSGSRMMGNVSSLNVRMIGSSEVGGGEGKT